MWVGGGRGVSILLITFLSGIDVLFFNTIIVDDNALLIKILKKKSYLWF